MSEFRYIKLMEKKLSPESFGGREPSYNEVYSLYENKVVKAEVVDFMSIRVADETVWLSRKCYEGAKKILSTSSYRSYYGDKAREGVTFTSANGTWLIVDEPKEASSSPGYQGKSYMVKTKLSEALSLGEFLVEADYVFKGIKGEDVEIGCIKKYSYFIAPYTREGNPLLEEELKRTQLWKNYLSREKVQEVLKNVSAHLRVCTWCLERMGSDALSPYKVVWRDVAKEFIPAVDTEGAVPDYTVNYVVVDNLKEAYYLFAVLLAPQINDVVRELSPWIGHVQPRFLRYFAIPKFDEKNEVHRKLAEIGEKIHEEKKSNCEEDVQSEYQDEIRNLVDKLNEKS